MEENAIQMEFLKIKSNFEKFNAIVDEIYSYEPEFNDIRNKKIEIEKEISNCSSRVQSVEMYLDFFRNNYSGYAKKACEYKGNFAEELASKIELLKNELEKLESQNGIVLDRGSLEIVFQKFKTVVDCYNLIEKEITDLSKYKDENVKERELYNSKLLALKNTLDTLNNRYELYTKKRNSFRGKIKCFFSRRFKNMLEKSIIDSLEESNITNREMDTTLLKIRNLEQENAETNKKIDSIRMRANQFAFEIEGLFVEVEKNVESVNEKQISVLKIAVDVGFVVGITAAITPIGSAIFL